MGRGKGSNEAQQSGTAVAELPVSRATGDTKRADRALVDTLLNKLFKAAGGHPLGSEAANKSVYRNFGTLDAGKEAMLCRIAKEQPEMVDKIKTIFILSNCMLAKKAATAYRSFEGFEEEDFVSAAMFGLSQVIDRFDPTVGSAPTQLQVGGDESGERHERRFKAAPTTLGYGRMRGELTREARAMGHGSGFNPKSLGEVKRRTQIALKELENEGIDPREITPQMIADKTGDPLKQVMESMNLLNVQMVRLDGHVDTSDGAMTIGDAIADENAEFEDSLIDDEFRAAVRAAVNEEGFLTESERFIITKYYGLDGDTPVGEKHFFDVVELKDGKQYASEQSVVADREQRLAEDPTDVNGAQVELISQREMTQLRADGAEVVPGTPEAAELKRILGSVPTQTKVQDDKRRALGKLAKRFAWLREDYTSRGRNALEHSSAITEAVRVELIERAEEQGGFLVDAKGNSFSIAAIEKMKQPFRGGNSDKTKSELRALAEHHGIVDVQTGALNPAMLRTPLAPPAAEKAAAGESADASQAQTGGEKRARQANEQRPRVAGSGGARSKTDVTALIDAGLLSAGEKLYASKTFKGETVPKHFVAQLSGGEKVKIISDGVDGSLEGKEFGSTSAAISGCYRRTDGGWKNWKVDRNGQRVLLETIRDEYDKQQASAA